MTMECHLVVKSTVNVYTTEYVSPDMYVNV